MMEATFVAWEKDPTLFLRKILQQWTSGTSHIYISNIEWRKKNGSKLPRKVKKDVETTKVAKYH